MIPKAAIRLRSLLSGVYSNRRLIFLRSASSSSLEPESAISRPRNRTANIFEDQSECGGSAAYQHALRYSRPHTIKLWERLLHLRNSVSLIGTVERPPTAYNRRGELGVYTVLSVKTSSDSHSSSRVLVEMWDEMAKVALEHVKSGDYIYVSGRLGSYKKSDSSGIDQLRYKVIVKELNYVKQHNEKQRLHDETQQSNSQGMSSTKKHEDRLHLWQIFFSNPKEWHDWRENKRNPRSPDFKHKSSGEALWFEADDPPWIKKQLELHDGMVAAGCFEDQSSRLRESSFASDCL